MSALLIIKQLALEHNRLMYPTFPDAYRVIHSYTDKTANGLTRCIIDFLNFSGHQAERISCEGRIIDERKTYTNALGFQRTIGSIKRVKSTSTVGTSDISATINGLSVKIEVKIKKDKQSDAQKQYQERIERAGGVYMIARNFEEFMNQYNAIQHGNKNTQGKNIF